MNMNKTGEHRTPREKKKVGRHQSPRGYQTHDPHVQAKLARAIECGLLPEHIK